MGGEMSMVSSKLSGEGVAQRHSVQANFQCGCRAVFKGLGVLVPFLTA
jgi:hypothetical protein